MGTKMENFGQRRIDATNGGQRYNPFRPFAKSNVFALIFASD